MVLLIEQLHMIKEYKPETLYLAVRIADRYITSTIFLSQRMPSLIELAATSLLIAAKLEENVAPNFANMSTLLEEEHKLVIKKQKFVDLEESIVRRLNFDLQSATPVAFLERFLRILGLDCK